MGSKEKVGGGGRAGDKWMVTRRGEGVIGKDQGPEVKGRCTDGKSLWGRGAEEGKGGDLRKVD